jgi:hypothetical protein
MPANAFIDRNQENERVGCTFIRESRRCQNLCRDLQFAQPASESDRSAALPFVIPTEVEGSEVRSNGICFRSKRRLPLCHPDRSAGICSSLNQHLSQTEAPPSPLSSRSKWRDLQFAQPASDSHRSFAFPFVIPTEVEGSAVRSTGI